MTSLRPLHIREDGSTKQTRICDASQVLQSQADHLKRGQGSAADLMVVGALIAIVGCDGAGKSTLAADILTNLQQQHRAQLCYLGLKSGEMGRRIKRFRFGGPAIERFLSAKASQTRTRGARIPGLVTALVVYAFSLVRLRRFQRMLVLRKKGFVIVTDRYPQTEVPGFYDGPGLSAANAASWPVAKLAAHERRMYEWMSGHLPDLVIRLNIDVDTARTRKPDHHVEVLASKVAATPLLRFNGAPIVDLDSRVPYSDVRAAALAAVKTAIATSRAG